MTGYRRWDECSPGKASDQRDYAAWAARRRWRVRRQIATVLAVALIEGAVMFVFIAAIVVLVAAMVGHPVHL